MIYDKLTPLEYLEFVAGLWGCDPATSEPAARLSSHRSGLLRISMSAARVFPRACGRRWTRTRKSRQRLLVCRHIQRVTQKKIVKRRLLDVDEIINGVQCRSDLQFLNPRAIREVVAAVKPNPPWHRRGRIYTGLHSLHHSQRAGSKALQVEHVAHRSTTHSFAERRDRRVANARG